MKILAIILNYKTADMTIKSSQFAIQALKATSESFQLVIVDNDSRDGSYETISSFVEQQKNIDSTWEAVTVISSEKNGGYGAGNNIAIQYALQLDDQPEYIYILNSDAFPDDLAIVKLSDHLDNNPKTGIAGSFIHGEDNEPHLTAFRFPSALSEFEDSIKLGLVSKILKNHIVPLKLPKTNTKVNWLAGASIMIRTQLLKDIGSFDETFFLYYEETDLCKRAESHGWDIFYIVDSKVAHIGSVSTGMKKWNRTPKYWFDSRRYYFIKNHGFFYYCAATILRICGESLYGLKCLLQNETNNNSNKFLTDLTQHFLKSLFKR